MSVVRWSGLERLAHSITGIPVALQFRDPNVSEWVHYDLTAVKVQQVAPGLGLEFIMREQVAVALSQGTQP